MNVLSNGLQGTQNGLSQQMMSGIQQVKGLMSMAQGNPMAMLQNNPQFAQVVQMCKGQNPQQVFENMCKQQGVNPNDIINALRN